MTKKRDRLQIIYDILRAIQRKNGVIKPTHILYKSNLSHQMLDEYLSELIAKEFIVETHAKSGKTYSLTPKGFDYIAKYKLIVDFADSFGLN
ncbi:MAG TPA: winged helix-turn-helix domain-containing protein [Candidatus Nanoarchaeia archaeon]|nr:winged helix-turn-helix domain-containing protein [Candidatus Nanoarchaeia archaeon]